MASTKSRRSGDRIGPVERVITILGGGALLVLGLRHRSLRSLPLAIGGGYLVYHRASGRSASRRAPDSPPDLPRKASVDPVQEASEESFPASDPPAWAHP